MPGSAHRYRSAVPGTCADEDALVNWVTMITAINRWLSVYR
jgi:hypothetical protein